MIGKMQLRRLYEDRKPRKFVETIREQLGLHPTPGRYHMDKNDKPVLKDPQIRPSEFSVRGLFEAINGEDSAERYAPGNRQLALLEAGPGPGVDATAFLNISAFNAAVSGLIEVKVLEGFNQPEFIGDKICQVVPTRLNGQKMIGVANMGDLAKKRLPSMPHAPAGLNEVFVETPETEEWGLKCDVTQEAVYFDLTGQVLDKANNVGKMVGYRRELRIIDSFIGVNQTYKYKGTLYGTYQTATPFINDQVLPLVDYKTFDAVLNTFAKLTDPETGISIAVAPKMIVSVPQMESQIYNTLRSTEIAVVDNQANAGTIRSFSALPPRVAQALGEPVFSILLYNRLMASATDPDYPGLGYNDTKAKGTFFVGDPISGHRYMENWPLRVRQASPNEYEMMDRGIVAAFFADERGVPAWIEPRYTQRNTPS